MTFEEWYEKWTGSKVKCENTDIIGAWQHQQSIIDELNSKINYALEFTENVHDENWQGVIADIVEVLK